MELFIRYLGTAYLNHDFVCLTLFLFQHCQDNAAYRTQFPEFSASTVAMHAYRTAPVPFARVLQRMILQRAPELERRRGRWGLRPQLAVIAGTKSKNPALSSPVSYGARRPLHRHPNHRYKEP